MKRALKSLAIFFAFVAVFTLSRHLATTSTTTTSTTVVPASTTTTSAPAGTTTCQGSDFRGAFNQGQGAAGTIYASITLTKVTAGTCTIKGWPLLTLQDHLGGLITSSTVDLPNATSQIQFLDSRANRAPRLVSLASGATTTFSLAYSDVPTGSETTCPAAQTVSVALAKGGSTVAVTPQYPPAPCNRGLIWVSPFY
ncbi:MAG: DUF4232 domain-containing protein [Acidobacteriota bacterium]|nr:DUF4232 domain-containing protein [Acidobacteriota bacterium]